MLFCERWKASDRSELEIGNLSGHIRKHGSAHLDEKDLEYYRTLRTPTVVEKADALLIFLAKEFPIPGRRVDGAWDTVGDIHQIVKQAGHKPSRYGATTPAGRDWDPLKYLSISGVANAGELRWLTVDYLRDEGFFSGSFAITPKGWQRIEQLRSGGVESRTGFVAMNFHEDFDVLFKKVIEPGIEASGYNADLVKNPKSNEKIDDAIIAGIRACRFMVADASRHRPNVYYEAGYAKGLGRAVIWMVEQCDVDKVHFDTRQYPFIAWTREDLPAARKVLQMRIEATIGRGPVTR